MPWVGRVSAACCWQSKGNIGDNRGRWAGMLSRTIGAINRGRHSTNGKGTDMLELKLREEFRGKRLKGTTVDFTNQSKTGALGSPATEFLRITYPSFDLLKTIEATGPRTDPVRSFLLGDRGQGKSHLLAALYHLCTSPEAGREWLAEWADRLDNPLIASLKLRTDCCVIAESLHLQRYKYLWDVLFQNHPKGEWLLGKWEGMGDKKTDVPSYDLMVEMFKEQSHGSDPRRVPDLVRRPDEHQAISVAELGIQLHPNPLGDRPEES